MFKKRYISFIFILFLCCGQKSIAQMAPVPDAQKAQTATTDSRQQDTDNSDYTNESQNQPVQPESSGNNNFLNRPFSQDSNKTKANNVNLPQNNNQQVTKTDEQNSKPIFTPPAFDNDTIVKKTVPPEWQPSVSSFLSKHHLDLNGIITILGLLGTFLGLFSTWSIYILNKKNNDPLVVDRRDCALKYIEALDRIKEIIFMNKTRKSDAIFEHVLECGMPPVASDEFSYLVSYYKKIAVEISEVPLIEVHSRYKKHIKYQNIELFNNFLSFYKMIQNDSKIFEENVDYNTLKLANRDWKHRINLLFTMDDRIVRIKRILIKDLKK